MDEQALTVVDRARMRAQAYSRDDLCAVAIGATKPEHWKEVKKSPHPGPQAVATMAEVIDARFGKPDISKEVWQDEKGHFLHFTCVLSARWEGRDYWGVGTASTREPFWSKAHGEDKELSEIDVPSVVKQCHTNAKYRVLSDILALGVLTWDEVKALAERGRRLIGQREPEKAPPATAGKMKTGTELEGDIKRAKAGLWHSLRGWALTQGIAPEAADAVAKDKLRDMIREGAVAEIPKDTEPERLTLRQVNQLWEALEKGASHGK